MADGDEGKAEDSGRDVSDLQFDRIDTAAPSASGEAPPSVTCDICHAAVGSEYFHVNGKTVCARCTQSVKQTVAVPRGAAPLIRAAIFGIGAAIAGAAIYYGVIALLDLEIGFVAILIGYMVGYSVRKGAHGGGGRRFQILAVVLTYWSVGLAYAPLAFKAALGKDSAVTTRASPASTSDSTATHVESRDSPRARNDSDSIGTDHVKTSSGSSAWALVSLFGLVFVLPVAIIFDSLPSGLLSALIILIGLRQAWMMTGAPTLSISGPYKVGAPSGHGTA